MVCWHIFIFFFIYNFLLRCRPTHICDTPYVFNFKMAEFFMHMKWCVGTFYLFYIFYYEVHMLILLHFYATNSSDRYSNKAERAN